jgi:hypothetical protein
MSATTKSAKKPSPKSTTKTKATLPVYCRVGMAAQGFGEPGVITAITGDHAIVTPDNGGDAEAVPWAKLAVMGCEPDPAELGAK